MAQQKGAIIRHSDEAKHGQSLHQNAYNRFVLATAKHAGSDYPGFIAVLP